MTEMVRLHQAETKFGPIFLASTERGLCRVTIPGEGLPDLTNWLDRKIPGAVIEEDDGALARSAEVLNDYFEGGPLIAPLLDLIGTPFQVSVWRAVLEVPYGETRSYAEVAERIAFPRAGRAVGAANAVNPVAFFVPCHRIVGADGSIKGYPGGVINRRMLLELEGARLTDFQRQAGKLARSVPRANASTRSISNGR